MPEKTLVEIQNPVTQTVDAVKALLAYMHRPAEPLPLFVALNDRVRLTLSKDKQAYYVTTAKDALVLRENIIPRSRANTCTR